MANKNLNTAKMAKNDEFYTQYHDIETEMNAYLEYNPDVFRGKTILLPCDDPDWSNFTKFFADNFEQFGIGRLISTSYAPESKKYKFGYQTSFLEEQDSRFDKDKTRVKGKIFVLDQDRTGDGRINGDDLRWEYLEGDGDFRSPEVTRLRDEADIIITNPPFSLFREFMAWLIEGGKQYILIANKNTISCKEVFPLIKNNKMWVGRTSMGIDLLFNIPSDLAEEYAKNEKEGSKYRIVDGTIMGRSASVWLTNVDHGRRHQPLPLMTMADNLKFSRHIDIRGRRDYAHYVNYDAIEVPYTDAIPSDYEGLMGVPISFLGKYCPEQFDIVGHSLECAKMDVIKQRLGKLDGGPRFYVEENGVLKRKYERILIRKKKSL